MASEEQTVGLTVKKSEDLSEWYSQVVIKSRLAEYSPVSGCIVFRPNSYELWENIKTIFDGRIKKTGHRNCYFPVLIPESILMKEKKHVEGFSPEVAWVTQGGSSKLSERLAIRPTSETIMYDTYKKWVRSWRDLPLLLNQWNSVVRWEFKHARPFLRTREFLWQEGHTVHATKEEAEREVMQILYEYTRIVQEDMAVAVVGGKKTDAEKFAGAEHTVTIEALMPDGKALQMGTSHLLSQNFAEAFDISFKDKDEKEKRPWQTSWGLSTRTIGAIILSHGDDKGIILPPRIAPLQCVVVPIIFKDTKDKVFGKVKEVVDTLADDVRITADYREDISTGWKFNEWELQGVPLRIEIGPKDVEKNQVVVVKRNTGEKTFIPFDKVKRDVPQLLEEIQQELFEASKKHLEENIVTVNSKEELKKAIEDKKLAKGYFCGEISVEEKMQEELGVVTRCLPFQDQNKGKGKCVYSGKETSTVALIGKSY